MAKAFIGASKLLLNKFRAFGEWRDMDDRLSNLVHESEKKRASFGLCIGRHFVNFVSNEPDSLQPPLNRISGLLAQTQDPVKEADNAFPRMRSALGGLRPLFEDIKSKRRLTQSVQERAEKSRKRRESLQSKVEVLRAKNPASPEFARTQDEYDRAVSQQDADEDALRQRGDQQAVDDKQYKKDMFLVVLNALELFATTRISGMDALAPFGAQLVTAAQEIPEYEDSSRDVLQTQIQTLRSEPLDE
jgi:hypothetical protein